MQIKCGSCGYETIVNTNLIKCIIGGGMIFSGAAGWVTYAFAGLLGFYGGAGLIAAILITGGAAVLIGKDLNVVFTVAQKITDFVNRRNYKCPNCEITDWKFLGFKDADVISGEDHKRELWMALRGAKKNLYIASGFLSSNVVNDLFIKVLESTLMRGVTVYFIVSDASSHNSDWMKPGYETALSSLNKISRKFPSFHVSLTHTHQKGIVVDDRYAITGSFNFLSNEKVKRKETSLKVYESKAILKVKRDLLSDFNAN